MADPIGALRVELSANAAQFERDMGKARKSVRYSTNQMNGSLGKFRANVNKTVRSLGALGAVSLAGLVATLGKAASAAAVFGESMAEVSTLLNDKSGVEELRNSVLSLSRAFGSDANAQAKALYQVISAGASDSKTAIKQLTAANKLAKGGVTTVTVAVDGLTSAMNAYGSEAGTANDVTDAFFTAVKAGKTTVGELSTSIGNVASIAAQGGVSLDELLAATAALTKGGVKTQIAMNGLRAIIAAVVKPSAEAATMAEELGLQFDATALKSQGLAMFLQNVTKATGGSTEQMAKLFGGVEALVPILALTGRQAGDFSAILDQMTQKAGETEKAFKTIASAPIEDWRKLRAEGEAAIIGIGDAILKTLNPAIKGATALIGLMRFEFGQFDSAEQELKFIDLRIKKIKDKIDELRSDSIPDIFQAPQLSVLESRLETIRDKYNKIADEVHRANAAAAAQTTPDTPAPTGGDVGAGPKPVTKGLKELREATADAQFELGLLTGGYTDAQKEALKFARAQGLLNQTLGDVDITQEQLKAYDELVVALGELGTAQDALKDKELTALEEYAKAAQDTMKMVDDATTNAFRSMEDALVGFVQNGKLDFRSLADSIIADIIRIQVRQSITGPLAGALGGSGGFMSILGGLFGGAKANGGPVNPGQAYLVGERGREMFVPQTSGSIVSNADLMTSPGGDVQVNVYAPPGSTVEQRETDGPDGRSVDIIIDEAVARNVGTPGSRTARAIRNAFTGVNPSLASR